MVYVDPLMQYGWKYGPSCHMIADSVEELHLFAARIGMRRSWFQYRNTHPHYDLTASRRKLAVAIGAKEITRQEFVEMIQAHREKDK